MSAARSEIENFNMSIVADNYQMFSNMLRTNPGLVQQGDLYNELNTPLHMAARHNRTRMATDLINAKSPLDRENLNHETPLLVAASRGHDGIVDLLLDHGATTRHKPGVAPLCASAFHGYEHIVIRLLAAGADPDETTADGKNALHHVAMSSHPTDQVAARISKLLITAGTNPQMTDQNGQKPEDVARSPKRKAILEKLSFGIDTESWRERQITRTYPRGF